MTKFLLVAVSVAGLAACSKKNDAPGADKAAGAKAAETKEAAKAAEPAAEGPIKMSAEEFYKDYKGLDGMGVMKKYGHKKVEVNGTVTQAVDGGASMLWLGAGEGANRIEIKFKDGGEAAKKKDLKKGDAVTAMCDIGGATDNSIYMIDCDLK